MQLGLKRPVTPLDGANPWLALPSEAFGKNHPEFRALCAPVLIRRQLAVEEHRIAAESAAEG